VPPRPRPLNLTSLSSLMPALVIASGSQTTPRTRRGVSQYVRVGTPAAAPAGSTGAAGRTGTYRARAGPARRSHSAGSAAWTITCAPRSPIEVASVVAASM
jgi:hypothetical protein